MTDENPARNPWRPWMAHVPYVDFEARALIRRLDPREKALLALLTSRAGSQVSFVDLSRGLQENQTWATETIARINKMAEALGYKPMIEFDRLGAMVPTEYESVIQETLHSLE